MCYGTRMEVSKFTELTTIENLSVFSALSGFYLEKSYFSFSTCIQYPLSGLFYFSLIPMSTGQGMGVGMGYECLM